MKNIHLLKNSICIVFVFFIHSFSFAQENERKITFLEESYDFGTLQEQQGEVKHVFQFINIGKDSIQLSSVRASCGCTTPFWEKTALMPGDTGKIVVAYNPLNRPGKFDKTVTVTSNAEPGLKILKISGFVTPKTLTVEDNFPTEIGDIRFKSKFLNFSTITTKEPVTKTFVIYNQSEDTVTFFDRVVSGDFISAKVIPSAIPPKEQAEIQVTYAPKMRDDLGFLNDQLTLFTDELENSNKSLSVIATILEYFPPMSEKELANAPHILFEEETYDFGHVNRGDLLKHTFLFKNTGKEPLNIRKTKTTCGCTVTDLKKMDYEGGADGELNVNFDTSGLSGSQVKRITLFTNDPTAPAKDIIIKAYVRE
ncbi:DUF1573 domain-containing protein [Marivirga sp. S37H4]|uniref:DUF1573 domain-containing protein n=1 Tax=Marivirga aurantiaca TaxID=2802615 RepID=A0A934WWY5_9BACT|nr:DUF1573 domain-containing protein [Marivirga aurantiaca]MBK6264638.1 DUF1573 domain-containing protein [Marivirga aurantiaca]